MYIAIRTDDGRNIRKISFYCNTLQVSRQAFYDYFERKGKPWKYQPLADAMLKIHDAFVNKKLSHLANKKVSQL